MQTRIDPVGDDTYRIATFEPTYNITFNQFLIVDDRPTLIHTGTWTWSTPRPCGAWGIGIWRKT